MNSAVFYDKKRTIPLYTTHNFFEFEVINSAKCRLIGHAPKYVCGDVFDVGKKFDLKACLEG